MQVCLGASIGIARPSSLLWLKTDLFTYGLGFLMLSMGLTLTLDDFKQVHARPLSIAAD
jgi:BASS family bile acid:Na+ symporter